MLLPSLLLSLLLLSLSAAGLPQATPTSPPIVRVAPVLHARATTAPSISWSSVGCVTDGASRALTGTAINGAAVSVEYCENFCLSHGYSYAGVEYSTQCFCGNALSNGQGALAPPSDCSMTCRGNAAETCGGGNRLNLYIAIPASTTMTTTTRTTTTTTHTTTAAVGPTASATWSSLGCVTDGASRALTGTAINGAAVSVEYCENFCLSHGFTYAGVEYSTQCFCGNSISNGQGALAPPSDCSMTCRGNAAETCGGGNRLNLYHLVGATAMQTTTTTTTHAPATTTASAAWSSIGCVTDGASRALTGTAINGAAVSVEYCENFCLSHGYSYAGVEYSTQCFCGNALSNGQGALAPPSDCTMTCRGNSAEICGGANRLNLYSHIGGATGTSTSMSTTRTSTSASATSTVTTTTKYVVAHHMVGNTYPYAQSDWANDIALAQANGIDGFALNYGSDSWQPARLADAYAAAVGTTFKLFLSADMSSVPGGSTGDATSLANQVKAFANHPNQLSYNGGIVLSTFSGETSQFGQSGINAGWQSVLTQIGVPVTFIPAWFVDPSTFPSYSVLSGAFNWNGGWPMSNQDITFASDSQWLSGLPGRLYIAPVTPNFFTHYSPQTYNKNWIYRSDDNLYATRWELVIQNRAQINIAEIITWNDYGESHYIGPIEGAQPNSQAWVNGFPHTAWLDMTMYYATAFKSGAYPSIPRDKIYIYARPHPKAATACCDSVSQPSGWQNTDDNFYVLVMATAAGTMIMGTPPTPGSATPSSASANPTTFTVAAGINKFKLALTPSNGMRATLMRGSTQVLDLWPQDYTFNPSPQVYNFNAYVNMAST